MWEAFDLNRCRWSPLALALLAIAACGGRTSGTSPGASCNDKGTVHANGTSWTCSDGCNSCSCENGQIGSTLVGCSLAGPDGGSCTIRASDYDQSCAADSDCVGVTAGNFCGPNPTCNCDGFADAISVGALGQFNADVAKTPSGPQVTCLCPMPAEPPSTTIAVCCKNTTCGVCTTVLPAVCTPMAVRCLGGGVNTCGPNGQWQQAVEVCESGTTCIEGSCVAVEAGVGAAPDGGAVASILGAGCLQDDAGVSFPLIPACITQIGFVGSCVVSVPSPSPEQCAELCALAPSLAKLPFSYSCSLGQRGPDAGIVLTCYDFVCMR